MLLLNVGPRGDGPFAVAVDVDITHITTAAVGIGGEVLYRHVVETDASPSPPQAVARHIVEAVDVLQEKVGSQRPVGIVVSMPGTVNRQTAPGPSRSGPATVTVASRSTASSHTAGPAGPGPDASGVAPVRRRCTCRKRTVTSTAGSP